MLRHSSALACLTALALFSGESAASGLQVSPISLTLQQNQRAEGLWLSNSGDSPVNAQVRVFHWSQSGYSDQLSSSQGLVISPPMLNIPPGGKQLIRVIRTGPPTKVEDAYRLSINELPPSTTNTTKKTACSLLCTIPFRCLSSRRGQQKRSPNCNGKWRTATVEPGYR